MKKVDCLRELAPSFDTPTDSEVDGRSSSTTTLRAVVAYGSKESTSTESD